MTDAGMKERWAAAQENVAQLDACPRHRFVLTDEQIAQGSGALFGKKLVCERCEGRMDLLHINQYIRGYKAAGGNPNDVMAGWQVEEGDGRTTRRYFKGQHNDD